MEHKQQHCVPCKKGTPPLAPDMIEKELKALQGWVLGEKRDVIIKDIRCKNFAEALAIVNGIGQVAEEENHHPDLALGWGYVTIRLTTHSMGGLHKNDFILAGRIDKLLT